MACLNTRGQNECTQIKEVEFGLLNPFFGFVVESSLGEVVSEDDCSVNDLSVRDIYRLRGTY